MAITRRTGNNACWSGSGERESLYAVCGKAAMENRMKDPQKFKNTTTTSPSVPLLGVCLKETKTRCWKDLDTLLTVAKAWKQPEGQVNWQISGSRNCGLSLSIDVPIYDLCREERIWFSHKKERRKSCQLGEHAWTLIYQLESSTKTCDRLKLMKLFGTIYKEVTRVWRNQQGTEQCSQG